MWTLVPGDPQVAYPHTSCWDWPRLLLSSSTCLNLLNSSIGGLSFTLESVCPNESSFLPFSFSQPWGFLPEFFLVAHHESVGSKTGGSVGRLWKKKILNSRRGRLLKTAKPDGIVSPLVLKAIAEKHKWCVHLWASRKQLVGHRRARGTWIKLGFFSDPAYLLQCFSNECFIFSL